jgi:hypothetical protein
VLTIDEDGDTTDVQDNAPKPKKSKVASQPVLQKEALIIEIDDIDDWKNEWLNKSNPTADIKEFFVGTPRMPGQDKARMLCKLCE